MSSILRNALCAACVALLPTALDAQTETRVMAHGGIFPFTTLHGGGQVEVTPRGGSTSYFAEYNRWVWGMICVTPMDTPPGGLFADDETGNRCSETGYTVHGGVTRHLKGEGARWRPYVSGAAGVARVLDRYVESRPVRLSLGAEAGYDVGGAGPFTLRLGARWQGRPQVGTDYFGPVVGLRLRL